MKRPKFALGSWAFSFGPFEKQPWSFEKFLEYSANAGYDGIEINGFYPHPHPEIYNSREKCIELKDQINGYGLGISGYAPDFRTVPPAQVPTEVYLKAINRALEFCTHLDIKTLRVDSINPPEILNVKVYQKRFEQIVSTWHAAASLCKSAGILLVWEFEPGFWLNKPSEIVSLVEQVNHDNFKILYDTSHAYMCAEIGARQPGDIEILDGGMLELYQKLSNNIGHFHLIDSDGTLHDDETSTHSPFGTGNIDFVKVLEVMRADVENLDWWCFDFCFCPTTEKDARRAIPFVENIIKQIV